MPATATLRLFTARELCPFPYRLGRGSTNSNGFRTADPDMVTPELLDMVRAIDYEVTEARRPL
jgi:hypothetical protein